MAPLHLTVQGRHRSESLCRIECCKAVGCRDIPLGCWIGNLNVKQTTSVQFGISATPSPYNQRGYKYPHGEEEIETVGGIFSQNGKKRGMTRIIRRPRRSWRGAPTLT